MLKDQKARTADADGVRGKAGASDADNRSLADAIFKRGRGLYDEGRFDEAMIEWEKLVGLVDEEVTLRSLLTALRQAEAEARAAAESARQAQASAPKSVQAPEEALQFLTRAEQKLREDSREFGRSSAARSNEAVDRQKSVDADLARASELYDQGRMDEAVALWEKIAGETENGAALLERVNALKTARAGLLNDRKMYEEVSAKVEAVKTRVPDEFLRELETANADLVRAVTDAKAGAAEAEKQLVDRRGWVDTKFREGKVLYDQGRFSEAIGTWDTLTPFLEKDSRFIALIADLKSKATRLSAADGKLAKPAVPLDEVDAMMVEYNVMTPEEIEKRKTDLADTETWKEEEPAGTAAKKPEKARQCPLKRR